MPIHAMIDIETLATDPHATILTIGGVKFNPSKNSEPHSEFYFKLDVDEQEKLGRIVGSPKKTPLVDDPMIHLICTSVTDVTYDSHHD